MEHRRLQSVLKILTRDLLICVVLGLVFAVLGVYDTDGLPLIYRIVFWTLIMCAGAALLSAIEPFVFGRWCKNLHPAGQVLLVSALITVPITVVLIGMNTGFTFSAPAHIWVGQYFGALVISTIAATGRFLFFRFISGQSRTETEPSATIDTASRFLQRLPLKFRDAALIAVSSEGHYLRVHTDRGSHLLLMRISDAIHELKDAKGLQTHRSWWVARDGIAEVIRENRRHLLVLKNDERAPVSRQYVPALRRANIISSAH